MKVIIFETLFSRAKITFQQQNNINFFIIKERNEKKIIELIKKENIKVFILDSKKMSNSFFQALPH